MLTGDVAEELSSTKKPHLSIIIGALNEASIIGGNLDQLSSFLQTDDIMRTLSVEVVMVVARCRDNTLEIVKNKVPYFQNLRILQPGDPIGKGRDISAGMITAKGDLRIFMDADLATPLEYLPLFYNHAKQYQSHVIIGTRNIRTHHSSKLRKFVSIGGNLLFRWLLKSSLPDTQCGFKLFTKEAAIHCFENLSISSWIFDMEVLYKAKCAQIEVAQIFIPDWKDIQANSYSRIKFINGSLHALLDLWSIWLNSLNFTSNIFRKGLDESQVTSSID